GRGVHAVVPIPAGPIVPASLESTGGNEVALEEAQRYGLKAEVGDELLFQIFYDEKDQARAEEQDAKYGELLKLNRAWKGFDRIVAFVVDIDKTARGPQIILSRTHKGLLEKLFEMEVPEIYEKIVRIEASAREAGARSKIAVSSRDRDVDPVGACVGMKGSRVQAVVQELRGEKID